MDQATASKIPDEAIEDKIIEVLNRCMNTWAWETLDVEFGYSAHKSYHAIDRATMQSKLVFGIPMMRNCMVYGMKGDTASGWDAVVHVTCHEFAHVIQNQLGLRLPNEVHTQDFYEIYEQVVSDFRS